MIELEFLGASRVDLETALVLAVLEQEPFRWSIDRPFSSTGRALIEVAAEVSSARIRNRAGEWSFEPTKVPDAGEYRFDLSTDGRENRPVSVSPILRILASMLSRTGKETNVRVRGGTHVASGSPGTFGTRYPRFRKPDRNSEGGDRRGTRTSQTTLQCPGSELPF